MKPHHKVAIEKYGPGPWDCCKCQDEMYVINVHHLDGDHGNNSPDNLVIMCQPCHASHHHKGKIVSQETKDRQSRAHLGKKRSPEAVAKTAAAHRGMKRSDETKRKMAEAQKGKVLTEEHRRKIQESWERRRQKFGPTGMRPKP